MDHNQHIQANAIDSAATAVAEHMAVGLGHPSRKSLSELRTARDTAVKEALNAGATHDDIMNATALMDWA